MYSKDHSGEKSVCDKKVEKKKVDDVITVTDRTSLLVVAALCAAEQVSLSELCLKLKKNSITGFVISIPHIAITAKLKLCSFNRLANFSFQFGKEMPFELEAFFNL